MFPEKQLEKLEKENKHLKQKIKEYEKREKIREKVISYFSKRTYYFGINLFKEIKEYGWELLEKAFIEVYNKNLKEKGKGETNE